MGAYFKFSFSAKNESAKKEKKTDSKIEFLNNTNLTYTANTANQFSLSALWFLIKFETKAIINNSTFIIIVVIGLINLIASLTTFSDNYGIEQYPVTYNVIDIISGSFYLFLIAIITFYTGVLVWKERDAKINEIQDATPIQTSLLFVSKLAAIIFSIALILSCTILIGIIAQACMGYHRYEIDVYVKSLLVKDLLSFSYLVIISLFFHYLINNRYIAYFAFVAFVVLNSFIWGVLKINSNLVKFGGTPSVIYSDMNGFGPFVPSSIWFNIYWTIASAIIGFVIFSF